MIFLANNRISLTSVVKSAQWKKGHTLICPICGKTFIDYGVNPYPIMGDGRCCDDCRPMAIIMDHWLDRNRDELKGLLDKLSNDHPTALCDCYHINGESVAFTFYKDVLTNKLEVVAVCDDERREKVVVGALQYWIAQHYSDKDLNGVPTFSKGQIRHQINQVKTEFKEKIVFNGVGFSYEEDREVLKDICMEIPKGKMVALVGQSGSGKSTLVDMIPRYYDVCTGNITLDGKDIREFRVKDLRSLIGNVNQEAILFNDTIFNNIAFGVEGATMEEVVAAAKIANAHDFIMEKEDGYYTNIGDRGAKLSGGQRQRISIARAILKNPPVLILDEATSALDTESEKIVQEALDRLTSSRTTIAIAHRLSTIRNADEICVMHEGKIVERGRHEELIAKDGYYKKLHDMQAL